jgi:hypothetical protein
LTYKPKPKMKMYKGYEVLNKADIEDNLDSMITILNRAREEMIKPLMFHFVVGLTSPDDVPSKLTQSIKEKFTSEINKNHKARKVNGARARKTPKVEFFYSIETKPRDSGELYNHIHIMFIVDAGHNVFGSKELGILINKALNRIDGFEKLIFNGDFDIVKASDGYTFGEGFLKFRDKNSTIYADDATFHDIRCHDLKTEFKDAVIRASYLCKSSQKKELPERYKGSNNQTFGGTRKLRATNSEKVA